MSTSEEIRGALPAPEKHLAAVPATYNVAYHGLEPEPEAPAVPLAHYLWILKRHRWKILSFVLMCVVATFIVSARITPIYESIATVDVDRRMPTGVIGQEAVQSTLNDADQFLATQVKLIQSDSVLRPVVEKYRLQDEALDPARGAAGEEAPVRLKRLKVARPLNTYLLLISYRSPDPHLAAEVANAIANSYIEHTYRIRISSSVNLSAFMEKQLEELKAKMERSSAALAQFERELNVINPEEKTSILSARLLQLNTEYTNAQAERVRKEAAHNSVRSGTLEAAQVSGQGEPLRKLVERLGEAQEKFAQVKAHYGPNHPEFRKVLAQLNEVQRLLDKTRESIAIRVQIEYLETLNRERMLQRAVNQTKAEFDRLNARSYEYQALKREAEADKKLYEELVRRIREAGINASFQNSAIRIADPARPARKPVFPDLRLNVALAFLLSSVLAVGAAVVSDLLDNTIRDPEQVARSMGTEVVGSLPAVKPWRRRLALSSNGRGRALVPLGESSDRMVNSFEEAIRTVRNSILLASFEHRVHSLMITSASPCEGKTTTAVHLALAHASQGYRTLLIDADLRRPGVHRLLGLNGKSGGFAEVLLKGVRWQDALVRLEKVPGIDILPAGPPSRRAADLIGRSLNQLLQETPGQYDLVVVDSPPLLGFPEPLQMAAAVDGVVLVALAGQTHRRALGSAVSTLQRLRVNMVGVVLNAVTKEMGDGFHYYGYCGKYNRYYGPKKTREPGLANKELL